MSNLDRRQFLKGVLGALAQGAGSVLLASTAVRAARADHDASQKDGAAPDDVQGRADQLAANWTRPSVAESTNEFLNVAVRPGFRNGWPNGGWLNRGWGNGGWPNGGWRNGGWLNRSWPNGGWRNGSWRNW